mmetsp:Transcript_5600/g.8531  ORF Transcript_5600/g.8531 Transcript_5600/m.8531 type:complete len:95 (-) Transcript_5600:27-311(-)
MRIHLHGEHIILRKVWWIESGQQQLQTVNLHISSAAHCMGADTASTMRKAAAGITAARDNGKNRTLAQQPCSGSGSLGINSASLSDMCKKLRWR